VKPTYRWDPTIRKFTTPSKSEIKARKKSEYGKLWCFVHNREVTNYDCPDMYERISAKPECITGSRWKKYSPYTSLYWSLLTPNPEIERKRKKKINVLKCKLREEYDDIHCCPRYYFSDRYDRLSWRLRKMVKAKLA